MAKKPTITTIASGYASNTQLNNNFTALRDGFNNTLSLDGSTPNAMNADLDMNSNDILNAGEVDVQGLKIDGIQVYPGTTQIATTYATQNYTGNGSTVTYAMGYNPGSKANVDVYIDGVYQNQDAFNISGTSLTFTAAPPLNSAIEIKVPVNVTSLTNTDSSQIVYNQGGTGAVTTNVKAKLQETVSVKDFGAVGDGVTDDTAAYQTALDYAIANNLSLDISGDYSVTSLSLDGANGVRLTGRGSIVGIASSATDALVTIKNVVNVAIDGAWFVNGNYNTNYGKGVWVYTDGAGQQAAYLEFTNLSIVNCKLAYQFGNDDRPNDLVSEINIRGGHTFGCPSVVLAVGAQTVINLSGATLTSLTGSGNAAWQALPQQTVVSRGATVGITGGELLHVLLSTGGSSSDFNSLLQVQPVDTGSSEIYGKITVNGTLIETAAPLVTTANTIGATSPTSGSVIVSGCRGVSTSDTGPFVETDTDYLGDLIFQGNNLFATTARGNHTIYCNGNANVYCDDNSFGLNFIPWIRGSYGGIFHYPYKMVLNVNDLNGQSLITGSTDLKFATAVTSNDLIRFSPNYNVTTGVFTVPAGGLKNVFIHTQLVKSGLTGELWLQINGTPYGLREVGTFSYASYSIQSLDAGDEIKITLVNTAGPTTANSTTTDWLQIFASN